MTERQSTSARRLLYCAAAALSLAAVAGCDSTGLSPREAAGRNFSSYVYSLETPAPLPAAAEDAPPARFVVPARIAVAQVGEVTPPSGFLERLRARPDLFSRVEAVSGNVAVEPERQPNPQQSAITTDEQARREVSRIQNVAKGMGMDHLLLVGGTIDQVTKENGLGLLDLTIVGAFVVPSKQLEAEAKASGALIDLASGRVVLFASADANRSRGASTVTREAGEVDLLREARDEVLTRLADQVVRRCEQRAHAEPVAGAG